jgi:murein DD-endopeptidase MepM/ murein hydrolase activator NlpD
MTSFFGSREGGFLVVDGQRIHTGLDTTTWCGDKVKAAHKGVVVAAGRRWAGEAGFRGSVSDFYARLERRDEMRLLPIAVIVDDGNGYRSVYVHLSKASVKVGQRVRKGQVIGLEGMTGNATGCHVHYELIRMDGPWMRVANALVREYHYPRWQRERVDPLRVLRMRQKRAGRYVPGIERPRLPPSLRASGSAGD